LNWEDALTGYFSAVKEEVFANLLSQVVVWVEGGGLMWVELGDDGGALLFVHFVTRAPGWRCGILFGFKHLTHLGFALFRIKAGDSHTQESQRFDWDSTRFLGIPG